VTAWCSRAHCRTCTLGERICERMRASQGERLVCKAPRAPLTARATVTLTYFCKAPQVALTARAARPAAGLRGGDADPAVRPQARRRARRDVRPAGRTAGRRVRRPARRRLGLPQRPRPPRSGGAPLDALTPSQGGRRRRPGALGALGCSCGGCGAPRLRLPRRWAAPAARGELLVLPLQAAAAEQLALSKFGSGIQWSDAGWPVSPPCP